MVLGSSTSTVGVAGRWLAGVQREAKGKRVSGAAEKRERRRKEKRERRRKADLTLWVLFPKHKESE